MYEVDGMEKAALGRLKRRYATLSRSIEIGLASFILNTMTLFKG